MEQLLLLGQIPGTSIHISFNAWLVIASFVVIAGIAIFDNYHQRRLLMSAIYLSLRHSKRKMLKQFDQIAL